MIAEAGKLFGSSLELEVILDRVVTQTAEALGDCCLIQLLDESGTLLLPGVTHHNDSDQARVFHDMVTHPRQAAEGVSGRALRTGEPILIARYERRSVRSAVGPLYCRRIPVRRHPQHDRGAADHEEHRLGVLVALRDVTGEPYDDTDLQLCVDLAERGVQAIYNARLMDDVLRADAERPRRRTGSGTPSGWRASASWSAASRTTSTTC